MASPVNMIQLLQGYLHVTTNRQQIVAANMANVDTPGYQTRDVNFQQAMQQAINANSGPQLEPASLSVEGLPERPDGNNVNIDRESMVLSEAQLQYQMGVQLIEDQFHNVLTAIKE